MDPITYLTKQPEGDERLLVEDADPHHIRFYIYDHDGLRADVVLNAVQVDKLRQQLHGWLHERANAEDGVNWIEHRPGCIPPYPTRGFEG